MIISFTGKKNSGKNIAATMLRYIALEFDYKHYTEWKDKYEECWEYYTESDAFDTNLKFVYKAFASKVKDVCAIITGLPRENFDDRDLRDQELGIEGLENPTIYEVGYLSHKEWIVRENYTYRTLMQRVGTEAMRDMIHQDIWVNALMQEYVADVGWKYDVKLLDKQDVQELNTSKYPDAPGIDGMSIKVKLMSKPEQYNNGLPNWLITDLRFANEAQAVIDRGGYILQIDRNNIEVDSHASEQSIHPEFVFMYIGNNGTLEELYKKLQLAYKNIQHDRQRKSAGV